MLLLKSFKAWIISGRRVIIKLMGISVSIKQLPCTARISNELSLLGRVAFLNNSSEGRMELSPS
jgi:hypothetical protein